MLPFSWDLPGLLFAAKASQPNAHLPPRPMPLDWSAINQPSTVGIQDGVCRRSRVSYKTRLAESKAYIYMHAVQAELTYSTTEERDPSMDRHHQLVRSQP
jgi:hypothetical protein